jgi:biotin carboxylase
MKHKKLAIIGASYLQLPVVNEAKKMGIETHCFAWSEGAVCKDEVDFFYPISVIDKEKILKICKEIEIDGILTAASDIGVPTVCFVAQNLGLNSNSIDSSEFSTNKLAMRRKFLEFGVSSPLFHELPANYNPKSLDVFLKTCTFPLIVKPVDRSGSRGVHKVTGNLEVNNAILFAQNESLSGSAIVEQFIDGIEVSVEAISKGGLHEILTITDKITTGEPYFVEIAHHQPSSLNELIQEKIKIETLKALNSLGISEGASHTEIKVNDANEVFLIEVGARMGGDFIGSHLVELSTGYNFLEAIILSALGDKIPTPFPNSNKNSFSGVYFLCKETSSILSNFEIDNPFFVEKHRTSDTLKSIRNSNDRSGYLIYKADKKIDLL